MEFTGILKDIVSNAKKVKRKIVLPESEDLRVIKAAQIIHDDNIAQVVLIGNREQINKLCVESETKILSDDIEIIDPVTFEKTEYYSQELYKLRQHKGMTIQEAQHIILDNVYFGTMMVKVGDADGLVSGAIHSTSDTLRPALQIIKQKKGINTVSAFFLMETKKRELGKDGVFIFADCGLNPFPTEEQLCDITISSAKSFKLIVNAKPRVACLSYSTKGSAKGEAIDKITRVVEKLKSMNLDYEVDGELQLDAAIVPEVAELKAPDSTVAGQANILIFPDLQAGNIGYKMAQRFGDMLALGPITQGLNKPINDLSRGCNVEDIVGAVAITCVQVED